MAADADDGDEDKDDKMIGNLQGSNGNLQTNTLRTHQKGQPLDPVVSLRNGIKRLKGISSTRIFSH